MRLLALIWILVVVDVNAFGRPRKRSRQANSNSSLNAESNYNHRKFAQGFVPATPEALIPDQIAMAKLPVCQHKCNAAFGNAIRAALQANNHHERFLDVCRHYNESLICHDNLIACPGRDSFEIMTSGLYYMCIDQPFNKIIGCLDIKFNEVQLGKLFREFANIVLECENTCRGQSRLSDWASKSGLLNLFSRSENSLRNFDPENLRLMMHDVCELFTCYLTCIRKSYNDKCGDNAGTLLSEAFVRPVAETQADPFVKSMSTFMYVFVPQQCSFFVREDALATHRIDPRIDEQLKRRAEEEEQITARNLTIKTKTEVLNNTKTQSVSPISNQQQVTSEKQPNSSQQNQIQRNKQLAPTNLNGTAIVGDMQNFDPIDIGEKWGFDIGLAPTDY